LAFYGFTEVQPWIGNHVRKEIYTAGAAISEGDICIMQSDGKVDPHGGTTMDTSTDGQGIIGVACHDAAADLDAVEIALLEGVALVLPTYTTAPTLAILGVAQTTLYGGYLDSSVYKIDLGNTTNGLFRFINFTWPDSRPLGATATGLRPKQSGWAAGDRVLCRIPLNLLFTVG